MSENAAVRSVQTAGPAVDVEHRRMPLRYYSPVPIALLLDTSLSNNAKVLAGLLLHYDGPRGCFPKVETLERDLNVSRHTIYRLVEELERCQFLSRRRRGRNNVYVLSPQYVPPMRGDDIRGTGKLAIENAPRPKPAPRKTLRKTRPEPTLPGVAGPVAPVRHIDEARHKRGALEAPALVARVRPIAESKLVAAVRHEHIAPERPNETQSVAPERPESPDTSQPCDTDSIKNQGSTENQSWIYNQQQQKAAATENTTTTKAAVELALINAQVAPEDAVRWAGDLVGLDLTDILDALRIMRSKPAYRRREIDRPGAYMRVLCASAVHMERELAEHSARGSRSAEIRRTEAIREAGKRSIGNLGDVLKPTPPTPPSCGIVVPSMPAIVDEAPSVQTRIEQLDETQRGAVNARALHYCRSGPESAAWPAALSMALASLGLDSQP